MILKLFQVQYHVMILHLQHAQIILASSTWRVYASSNFIVVQNNIIWINKQSSNFGD